MYDPDAPPNLFQLLTAAACLVASFLTTSALL